MADGAVRIRDLACQHLNDPGRRSSLKTTSGRIKLFKDPLSLAAQRVRHARPRTEFQIISLRARRASF